MDYDADILEYITDGELVENVGYIKSVVGTLNSNLLVANSLVFTLLLFECFRFARGFFKKGD